MHPRVESLPEPTPDCRNFLAAVRRKNTGPVPLVELAIDVEIIAALADQPMPQAGDDSTSAKRTIAVETVRVMHRLGYDVVKTSASIPFGVPRVRIANDKGSTQAGRQWQAQHTGCIQSTEDLERFHWPTGSDIDFGAVDAACEVLPDGMALVGFCGGVLEYTTDLLGLERFMYAVYDAPDLIAAVFENVGQVIYDVCETYCHIDQVCAIWLGDDLGSKNGLLVAPDLLERHVFPWYKRLGELADRHGRVFLLHSCGNMYAVMDYLVDEVGIYSKHSFEDNIMPVEQFTDRWGDKVSALGGVDVNLLTRGPEEAIVARTQKVLEHAAPTRGHACGSGNSIPNYVPLNHYLAMVETLMRFNGRI